MKLNTAKNQFNERGFIRISKKDREGKPITFERAEEIGIEAGAEEVVADDPETPSDTWTLETAAEDLYPAKGFIEKNIKDVEIVDYENSLVPIHLIELSDTDLEQAAKLCDALQELEEVTKIHANIS